MQNNNRRPDGTVTRSNRFCFTYFLFSSDQRTEEENHKQLTKEERSRLLVDWSIRFLRTMGDHFLIYSVGEEYSPTTGKTHYQGFIKLTERIRLQTLKQRCNIPTIHLEACRGTDEDNIKYTKKDNAQGFPEKVYYEQNKEQDRMINEAFYGRKQSKEEQMHNFLRVLRTKGLGYVEANYPVQFYREMPLIQKYRQYKMQGSECWNGELPNKNF